MIIDSNETFTYTLHFQTVILLLNNCTLSCRTMKNRKKKRKETKQNENVSQYLISFFFIWFDLHFSRMTFKTLSPTLNTNKKPYHSWKFRENSLL